MGRREYFCLTVPKSGSICERESISSPKNSDAVGVFVVGGVDFDDVATDAEGAAAEVDVVAVVEDFDEAAGDVFALEALALFEEEEHAVVGFGGTQAVDAGDGTDDDGVAAFEEAAGGGEAEFI